MLKSGDVAFDPPLPAEKIAAIRHVGYGNFEKVALRFDHPFWEDGVAPRTHLHLASERRFPSGLVQLSYTVARDDD